MCQRNSSVSQYNRPVINHLHLLGSVSLVHDRIASTRTHITTRLMSSYWGYCTHLSHLDPGSILGVKCVTYTMMLWGTMSRSSLDFFTFHPPIHTIDLVSVWIWSISVNNMAFWNPELQQIDMSHCLVLQGYVEKNIITFQLKEGSKSLHPSTMSKT